MITNINTFRVRLLVESAKTFSDTEDILLLIARSKSSLKMALYDTKTSDVIGYVQLSKPQSQPYWEVERINAEKGYGPFLYDLAMMRVYPYGIKPASLIKPAALSVYKYYMSKRPEVKKMDIRPSSPAYVDSYRNDVDGEELTDAESLRLINQTYHLEPTTDFLSFVKTSEDESDRLGLNIREIMKMAERQFLDLYYQEAK